MLPEKIKLPKAYKGDTYVFPTLTYLVTETPFTSGSLEAGEQYIITKYNTPDSFTNVGGTNVTGNIFEATDTTPTVWKHLSELAKILPLESDIVNVRIHVRDLLGALVDYLYLGGGITLTGTEIAITSKIINYAAGDYVFDVEITFADDTIETPWSGCLTVVEDVTDNEAPTIETMTIQKGVTSLSTNSDNWSNPEALIIALNGMTWIKQFFDAMLVTGNGGDATNDSITIKGSGYAYLNYSATMLMVETGVFRVKVTKNGDTIAVLLAKSENTTNSWQNFVCSAYIEVADGDLIEVYISRETSGATTVTVAQSSLTIIKI